MEINTLTRQEYNEDVTRTQLREIFEPERYIAPKQTDCFGDIKTCIQEMIENIISPKELSFNEQLNDKFLELDFGSEFCVDATKIGVGDAVFFINLLKQENYINYSVQDDSLSLTTIDDKKINATNSLLNMLKTSFDTKKPIRLDFDRDVTVILKLDKDGKIQAHFIPGTPEVEAYLKNNISCLKQTFNDEDIKYSYLGYSKHKENNNQKNNKKRSNK